jgi:hypothetical protein
MEFELRVCRKHHCCPSPENVPLLHSLTLSRAGLGKGKQPLFLKNRSSLSLVLSFFSFLFLLLSLLSFFFFQLSHGGLGRTALSPSFLSSSLPPALSLSHGFPLLFSGSHRCREPLAPCFIASQAAAHALFLSLSHA